MRKLSNALIGIVLVTAVIADQAAWNAFKQKYGKKYKNNAEERARMKTFQDNLSAIAAHNKLYNNRTMDVTHEKGVNRFSHMTHEEFESIYAHNHKRSKDPQDTDDKTPDDDGPEISDSVEDKLLDDLDGHIEYFEKPKDVDIPAHVDWRDKGAVTSVKSQCGGSCGLYGPIGATEAQNFFKTGLLISLSAQNLMDCLDPSQRQCYAVLPEDVYSYMRNQGIDSARSYPFKNDMETCNFDPQKSATRIQKMVKIRSGDEEALKYAIATVVPIAVGLDLTELKDYKSGTRFDKNCSKKWNHVVLAVGYGSDDKGDYYILKNQWGDDWGDNGYFKVARNRNSNCGIGNYATFPKL